MPVKTDRRLLPPAVTRPGKATPGSLAAGQAAARPDSDDLHAHPLSHPSWIMRAESAGRMAARPNVAVCDNPAPCSTGPGSGAVRALAGALAYGGPAVVHACGSTSTGGPLARQWVDLSPLQMWVLPDSVPACRGPTIAYMGFVATAGPRACASASPSRPGPLCPVAGGGPHSFVHQWWTRPGGTFVPDSGLSAAPC